MSVLFHIAGSFATRTGSVDFFSSKSDMVRAGWDRRVVVGEGWAKRLENGLSGMKSVDRGLVYRMCLLYQAWSAGVDPVGGRF